MVYIPQRGDVVWVNFSPQVGREQKGKRPALVISPKDYNKKVGLAIMCPITNQVKGYPFEVLIPKKLKVTGAILSDHIKNLDWKGRKVDLICVLPEPIVSEVLEKLYTLL